MEKAARRRKEHRPVRSLQRDRGARILKHHKRRTKKVLSSRHLRD